jgi:Tfp pilus assembly protein PilX
MPKPKIKTGHPRTVRRCVHENPRGAARARHRGVVLIIALIMLVIISLLATLSMRNAVSTEKVSGTVRTTELAAQAAEIALRHCEQSVAEVVTVASGGTATFSTSFTLSKILPVSSTPQWQSTTIWDSTSTATYVLPLTLVNQSGLTATYKRPPECMVEPLPLMLTGTTVASTTASFVVTARGFGPEVAAADVNRARPVGTEVWLQSHIELQ